MDQNIGIIFKFGSTDTGISNYEMHSNEKNLPSTMTIQLKLMLKNKKKKRFGH